MSNSTEHAQARGNYAELSAASMCKSLSTSLSKAELAGQVAGTFRLTLLAWQTCVAQTGNKPCYEDATPSMVQHCQPLAWVHSRIQNLAVSLAQRAPSPKLTPSQHPNLMTTWPENNKLCCACLTRMNITHAFLFDCQLLAPWFEYF